MSLPSTGSSCFVRDSSPGVVLRSFRRGRGFTLVELLVVMGLIALLAAMLSGVVSNVKRKARTVACLSNLREIGLAVRLYANDHNQLFPPVYANSGQTYVGALSDYLATTDAASKKNVFVSPAAAYQPTDTKRNYTYSVHDTLFGSHNIRMTNVLRPSEVIMAANGAQIKSYGYSCSFTFYNPWQIAYGSSGSVTDLNAPVPATADTNVDDWGGQGYFRYVQNNNTAVNCLMVDGHAETIAKGKVLYRNVIYDR